MDKPLFTFGIITDTHVRPPGGDDSSPYPVNARANARAKYAAELLAAQNPDFTIHLGDMVHTLPHMPTYDAACEHALELLAPLQPNLSFVAGNHDIGDKPMVASPAAGVNDTATAHYTKHFGKSFYFFEQNNCAFVVINSSLINSGTAAETEQKNWLEQALSTMLDKRVFLFSHYPPFIHDPDEQEHYDNLSQPGRQWLLDIVENNNIETVFSGHVHHFIYNHYKQCTLCCLPATSFTRQDYAELFHVSPSGDEFGRDDTGKLSVALVEVYGESFKLRIMPTDGREWSDEEDVERLPKWRTPERKDIIVYLRHAWHESVELPYNGPMEEFSRKRVHNDYTLLRLVQMGIRYVRVPLADLQNERGVARMRDYRRAGIHFHLFQLAPVTDTTLALLESHADLVESLEIICPDTDLDPEFFTQLRSLPEIDVYVSKIHSSASHSTEGEVYAHTVSNGFVWQEQEMIMQSLAARKPGQRLSGVVFQLPLEDDVTTSMNQLSELFSKSSLECIVNLRLGSSNPAEANFDDSLILKRVSEALECSRTLNNVTIQIDTFADLDRGFAPRHGFVDRRFNLRPAGRMLMRWEKRA